MSPQESKTAPFTLGPSLASADFAVLLLHGFTGSPWEVRPLGESLAARRAHVFCPRLPGHGSTPEAMLYADHRDWLRAASDALEQVQGARKVVLAGLSMGALLAMILAGRRTRRVDALVLLAPVLRFHQREARLLRALRFLPVFDVAPKWVQKSGTDIELDEVRAESPVIMRYPLARAFDLMALQDLAKAAEPRITCPSLVVGAAHDHVVDTDAALALADRLPFSKKVLLQRGFHIIPRDTDRALAFTEIHHFLDTVVGASDAVAARGRG
ncbi:MAG: alpha/beta hydrolase [Myxococcota bacterium]